jgi:hypothetical protein
MASIPLTPVESSNIKAIGYDPNSRTLHVQFNSGATHQYEDVSPDKHAALMAADSKGSHFHANIKNAHTSSRVE